MAEHTPGPWRLQWCYDSHGKASYILGNDYVLYEPVCIIPHDDHTAEGAVQIKANARLIAAAPDLLEALNKCRDFARGAADGYTSRGIALDDIFEAASDAVAKATNG
jgi:hypothetical protein